ncbi:MAG: zf-HC2 domain-containing protein [Pirellulaceae bacterium]|nr:zf-HC2 domain-containing protein [Pirellulaceae bacterium]
MSDNDVKAMRCRIVQQKLDLIATPEIADSERERIEGHLRSCPACQQALARHRELQALLQTVLTPPVPDGFPERVLSRAARLDGAGAAPRPAKQVPSGRAWGRVRVSLRMAASLAAGLWIGMFLGQQTWQAIRQAPASAPQPDAVAASVLDSLLDPGDDTLAGTYLQLTSSRDG